MAYTSLESSSSSDSEVSVAGLQSVEDRLVHYKKNKVVFEESINVLKLEVRLRDNALDEYKMKLEKVEKERDQLKQTLEKFQNSSKSLNDLLESQVIDKSKTGLGYDAATTASPAVESFVNLSDKSGSDKGYHSVPPPLTGNFIPRKPDLTFMDEIVKSENLDVTTVVTPSNDKTVENKGVFNTVESNIVRKECCALINEELVSDGKKKTVFPTVSKIEFVRPKQPEKPVRKPVKYVEMYRSQRHKGNQRNWNNQKSQQLGSDFVMYNKACFVCGSFDHQKKDYSKRMVKPVWNNARRVNHQNSTRMTHPNSKRNMIPQAVLMRPGLKIINTARSRAAVNVVKPKAVHNAVKRNRFHDVKALACWVWKPKNRVIDHVSKHNNASIILKKFDYIDAQGRFNTASPEVKTAGDSIEDIAAETLVYIRRSAAKAKDKGKAKMEESESAMTKTKRQQEQERLGFIVAVRLQAEFNKEERQRISRAEGLKTDGYRVTTAGSRLLLLIQGRKITEIDQDLGISLVQHDVEIQGSHEHEPEFDFDAANVPVTTAGAEISIASPEVKTAGDSIEDIAAETLVYIRRSAAKPKDKGKAKMEESESAMTKTKGNKNKKDLVLK
ncbi:hypothetical protein Tco_1219102 [Tanacetum coccineum]